MVSFCCLLLVVVLFFLSPQAAALKLDFSWERPLNWITMQSNQTIFQWTINQIQSNVHWNNYCNHNIYSLVCHFKNEEQNSGFLYVWAVWYRYHIEFFITIFNHFSTARFQYANFDFILMFFFSSFTLTLYQFLSLFSSFFHRYFSFCLFIYALNQHHYLYLSLFFSDIKIFISYSKWAEETTNFQLHLAPWDV